ncbi:MAG: 4Fe-4S dicluster domain-containing protein [Eubacteriales bacterium]
MSQFAMVIDVGRCIACHSCTVACRENNNLPLDMIYNPVTTVGPKGVFPNVHMVHLPLLCMHCENAPCVDCCPTGASQKSKDGIIWVDEKKCVGCKACIMACPYGARVFNEDKGSVQKCNFCMDLTTLGEDPYCVKTCHQKARIFGDLEDETSEVYKIVKSERAKPLMPELGTKPKVFYKGLED